MARHDNRNMAINIQRQLKCQFIIFVQTFVALLLAYASACLLACDDNRFQVL